VTTDHPSVRFDRHSQKSFEVAMSKKRETSLERWTRIAKEAAAISEGMRRMNPDLFDAAQRSVRKNVARIPQFAALRKLH
jgi:hypothetical protein